VKYQRKTIGVEGKFDVISQTEKEEQIVVIFHNVRLARSSICIIYDNADGNKGSAKCLDNIKSQQSNRECLFVQQDYYSPI
jgi:hypothetical protein